jgi:hypothetical protein
VKAEDAWLFPGHVSHIPVTVDKCDTCSVHPIYQVTHQLMLVMRHYLEHLIQASERAKDFKRIRRNPNILTRQLRTLVMPLHTFFVSREEEEERSYRHRIFLDLLGWCPRSSWPDRDWSDIFNLDTEKLGDTSAGQLASLSNLSVP